MDDFELLQAYANRRSATNWSTRPLCGILFRGVDFALLGKKRRRKGMCEVNRLD